MSVQVRARREAAAFLSTYVGAQGELLVDTTNNRVQVHDGATPGGWPAARLADVAARTNVADAAYTALASDRTIVVTSITAARTITLPAASAFPTGLQLLVFDESGACSATNTITLARAGTDTINGSTSAVISTAYGYLAFESNGAGKWTVVDQTPTPGGGSASASRTALSDANYTALSTDRMIAVTALTASRTITLPSASAYPTGVQLVVVDETGNCASTTILTLARAGSDTINGAASAILASPYAFMALESNGAGKWTVVDQPAGAATAMNGGPLAGFRNLVINGNFIWNQLGYASGTVLAAGTFGHDRWGGGSGGVTYTFTQGTPDTAITITAGSLMQAVEGLNVAGGVYMLSWTGTATGRLYATGTAAGSKPTYAASPIMVAGTPAGVVLCLEFSTGSLGLVQLEPGVRASIFERRPPALELTLCQRYLEKSYAAATKPGTITQAGTTNLYLTGLASSANSITFYISFKTPKRAAPTVTAYSCNSGSSTGSSGSVAGTGRGFDNTASVDVDARPVASGEGGFGLYSVMQAIGAINIYWHWVASCELPLS